MALKKSLEINNTGISGEYIRLDNIKFLKEDTLLVILDIYANQALREQDKQPLTPISIYLKDKQFIDQLKQLVYNKVKLLENFEGAEDV